MSKTKIITDGVLDGLTWLIITGAVLLAMATQALKAAGVKPPLSGRDILIRSLGAGLSALTIGLLLMGTGKITLHWALFLGAGGLIGYWGQEALGFVLNAVIAVIKQNIGGQGLPPDPPAPMPPDPPPYPEVPDGPDK